MFDLTSTANEFLARIGAPSWANCADWINQAEFYNYCDEAAKRLADLGLFVMRDTVPITAGHATYEMTVDWLDSIHTSVNGSQIRSTSSAELLALDSLWPQTACEPGDLPTRVSYDAGPLGTVTLYPIPSAAGELETIGHVAPEDISQTQTTVPVPSVLSDYFLFFALQRARGKESPYAMPEVAAAAGQRVALYEQVLTAYWGGLE